MRKILWIGPVVDPSQVSRITTLSPAANAWQLQFLSSIPREYELTVLSLVQLRRELKINDLKFAISANYSFSYKIYKLARFPIVRDIMAVATFLVDFVRWEEKKFDIIFCYNETIYADFISLFFRNLYKTKSILISADGGKVSKYNGTIHLSRYSFEKDRKLAKWYFEGGTNIMNRPPVKTTNTIVYVGMLSKYTGIYEFAHNFVDLGLFKNYKLIIFGKGDLAKFSPESKACDAISFMGYQPDNVISEYLFRCSFAVNPRDSTLVENMNNFPSKILYYLNHNCRVLSTWTYGIPEEYRDYLYLFSNNEELVELLEKKVESNDSRMARRKFVMTKAWKVKVPELIHELL